MKDNYELKNPRSNPYAERMKNGYTIIIERGSDTDSTVQEKKAKPGENQKQSAVQTQ